MFGTRLTQGKQLLHLALAGARNVLAGGNLAALGLVRSPRRLVYYATENLFWYQKIARREGVRQKNVYEVLPASDEHCIRLGNLTSTTWFWSPSFTGDLVNLCLICQMIKPKVVFEIGTLTGYTAYHFALNTPDDARIYTLDLPKECQTAPAMNITIRDRGLVQRHSTNDRYHFERSAVAAKVTCLYGDSATFDFSPYQGLVDLFFIDGAHSYEYARSDTLNALRCCHPGSVIVWHDFGRVGIMGVSRWVVEFSRDHEVYTIPNGSLAYMVVR